MICFHEVTTSHVVYPLGNKCQNHTAQCLHVAIRDLRQVIPSRHPLRSISHMTPNKHFATYQIATCIFKSLIQSVHLVILPKRQLKAMQFLQCPKWNLCLLPKPRNSLMKNLLLPDSTTQKINLQASYLFLCVQFLTL